MPHIKQNVALYLLQIAVVLSVAGCGGRLDKAFPGDAQWILKSPDSFELIAVDPTREKPPADAKLVGGYRILGEAPITDKAVQQRLVDTLYDAVNHNDGSVAACFNPRHAIRAVRDGKIVEIVICFECHSLQTTIGGARGSGIINPAKESYFNEVATAAALPLAAKKK